MNEEIEYAEMLEIPVSTVNVVRKNRRRKKSTEGVSQPTPPATADAPFKDTVIAQVNDRLEETEPTTLPQNTETLLQDEQTRLDFDPVPDRIDTVRLYASEGKSSRRKKNKLFAAACVLCGAIFFTNIFMPSSAINTFFRAMSNPSNAAQTDSRPYSEFDLSPVVSELSDAELNLSETGVLSFTDECCVYPAADGTVSDVTKTAEGIYTVKISHSDSFTGVIQGLDYVYYEVGDAVKSNVPVGFSKGEREVQVTMYSAGELLNCFRLTDENCLAWVQK